MALPNISTPEFITQIPSTGEEIKFRPFLVREEKLLLMALEGEDQDEIQNAIMKILEGCILTPVDMKNLAMFDVEFLFLQLRGKSVGEVIELQVGHQDSESECKHRTDVKLKIDDIKVQGEIPESKVMLTDDIGVKLKFLSVADMTSIPDYEDDTEKMFAIINKGIEYIFDEESVYNEFTDAEINEWVNTLNQSQFQKIVDFVEKMPKLKHELTWKCEKCGKEENITLEGLQSFFM
jgi:hypothetical protein